MKETQVEIYPMVLFPTFKVRDVAKSVEWYVNVLGFSLIYQMPDPNGKPYLAHVRKLKHQDLLLVAQGEDFPQNEKLGVGVTITFGFSDPVDDFVEKVSKAGAIAKGPIDRPWNTRDLIVTDLDGYRLVFTSPGKEPPKAGFEETMKNVQRELFKNQPGPG